MQPRTPSSQQESSTRTLAAQGADPGASQAPMNPGDEAPAGTPGTAEDICPDCSGSGKKDGSECSTCGGSGRVVEGIGGG